VESKFFIESLGFSLHSINISNLPSLVGSIVSVVNLNFLSFDIFTLVYIKAYVSLLDIAEVFSAVHKDLEPLRVGTPDLHFLGLSCTLDVP